MIAELFGQVFTGSEPEDESRRRILDAAAAVFIDFGIRRASMDDIARRAGLGRATLYRRFPHKDGLVQAALLAQARDFLAEMDRRIQGMERAEDQLAEGFVAFVTGIRRHPLLTRLLATEPEDVLPWLTVNGELIIALGRTYAAGLIRGNQDPHQPADYDADLVAEMLVRLGHSLLLTPGGAIPLDDEQAMRAFAHHYLMPLFRTGQR